MRSVILKFNEHKKIQNDGNWNIHGFAAVVADGLCLILLVLIQWVVLRNITNSG